MKFWSFASIYKTVLEQPMWICKWVGWWCHCLTTCNVFCTYNFDFDFFFFIHNSTQVSIHNIFSLSYFWSFSARKFVFLSFSLQRIEFLSYLWTWSMETCEAVTSSTHSFAYSHRLFKNCFVNTSETSKFHNFLIFCQISVKISLLCL